MAGPTGCGKTTLLTNLIEQRNSVCTKPPVEVIYCYGAYQERFTEMPDVNFHEGMIDVDDIPNDGQHRWLILDDLMAEIGGTPELNALFTKHSHHRLISVFFLVQKVFLKDRTPSENAHYFFVFKSPRDSRAITTLATQMFPGRTKYMREAYQRATSTPFSHLLIDLRQETDDRYRLKENFGSDRMALYVPT